MTLNFNDEHHVQITAYLVEGKNDWTRPPDEIGREIIGGVKVESSKWMYREVVEAHLKMFTARILKSLEDMGVLE